MTREEIIQGLRDIDTCQIWESEVHDEAIKALEQEPKKSYWIEHDTYYDCSLCGCVAPCTEMTDSFLWKLSNYCPDCGAKMENQMYRRNRKRG